MKIANAFSISMLPAERGITTVSFSGPLSAEQLTDHLNRCAAGVPIESAIGHADTAAIVSQQLGILLQANRVSIQLRLGEHLVVAQYVGPRLPEGATELPPGAKIDYYVVVVVGRDE